MLWVLEARAFIKKTYQKASILIDPIVKFFIAFIILSKINTIMPYDERFVRTSLVLLLSLVSAFTPGVVLVLFCMLLTLVHIYSVSTFLAIFVACFYIILYCLLLRFTPKFGMVVIVLPVLASWNLGATVPLFLGLMANPLTILPTACGSILSSFFKIVQEAASRQVTLSLDDILQLYTDIIDALISDKLMIITVIVYACVIAVVYVIRKFQFDFAFEISVLAGVVTNILGFLIGDLKFDLDIKIGTMILMSIVSGVLVMIAYLFYRILSYTRIERVQFEDDDYYYYVKAVPKIKVDLPDRSIKIFGHQVQEDDDQTNGTAAYELNADDSAGRTLTRAELDQEMQAFGATAAYDEEFEDELFDGIEANRTELLPEVPEGNIIPNEDGLASGEYDFDEDEVYEEELTLDEEEDTAETPDDRQ